MRRPKRNACSGWRLVPVVPLAAGFGDAADGALLLFGTAAPGCHHLGRRAARPLARCGLLFAHCARQPQQSFRGQLVAARLASCIIPRGPGGTVPMALWPGSAVLAALVQRMDADPPAHRELRAALLHNAPSWLADALLRREPARGTGSGAEPSASAGFPSATDGESGRRASNGSTSTLAPLVGKSGGGYVSQEHGDASSLGDALLSAMFHLRAGLFEMTYGAPVAATRNRRGGSAFAAM